MAENKSVAQMEYDDLMSRAKFCADYAATLNDAGVKASLLDMAAKWRQLAEEVKTRDRS
jgi:hypothetical protein